MSDFKPQPPYATIEEEFEDRIRKAFTTMGADGHVIIYSRRQRFQMESIWYCQSKGWIDDGEFVELDEQSTEYRYRLTDAGKQHFGL